ncbi:MAG TPA: SRPBCC family protein [Agromyces sp.]|nr:SRPBCC family protein [Agromyces sp.]
MGVLEYSVWIEAAPEAVWRVYVDPARIPEWQTGRPVIAEAQGELGAAGSSYVSRRGPLAARTTVLTSDPPHELVTSTDAYLGLQFEVASRLTERAGGTDLRLRATTRGRRGFSAVAWIVERAVLSPAEAQRELANLKALVEREASR